MNKKKLKQKRLLTEICLLLIVVLFAFAAYFALSYITQWLFGSGVVPEAEDSQDIDIPVTAPIRLFSEPPEPRKSNLSGMDMADEESADRPIAVVIENYYSIRDQQEGLENAEIVTFAVVKDGEWYERGEMGWWGIVSDEKDTEVWNNQFNKLLNDLPEDTLLSMYDCHI